MIKPALNHQSSFIILGKEKFPFLFCVAVLASHCCGSGFGDERDFFLSASFKQAHLFHAAGLTLAPEELLSMSPCQQGTMQIWLYPLGNTDVVQYPRVEMPVQLSSTLWHIRKMPGNRMKSVEQYLTETLRTPWTVIDRGEGWRGGRSVIQVGHILTQSAQGFIFVIYILQLINRSIYLVTDLIAFRQ